MGLKDYLIDCILRLEYRFTHEHIEPAYLLENDKYFKRLKELREMQIWKLEQILTEDINCLKSVDSI